MAQKSNHVQQLAYERYVADWEKSHMITAEEKAKARVEYYKACEDGNLFNSFEAYLVEYGYYGELYVTAKEFLSNEYLDKEYMKGLFPEADLYQKYLKDVA